MRYSNIDLQYKKCWPINETAKSKLKCPIRLCCTLINCPQCLSNNTFFASNSALSSVSTACYTFKPIAGKKVAHRLPSWGSNGARLHANKPLYRIALKAGLYCMAEQIYCIPRFSYSHLPHSHTSKNSWSYGKSHSRSYNAYVGYLDVRNMCYRWKKKIQILCTQLATDLDAGAPACEPATQLRRYKSRLLLQGSTSVHFYHVTNKQHKT